MATRRVVKNNRKPIISNHVGIDSMRFSGSSVADLKTFLSALPGGKGNIYVGPPLVREGVGYNGVFSLKSKDDVERLKAAFSELVKAGRVPMVMVAVWDTVRKAAKRSRRVKRG